MPQNSNQAEILIDEKFQLIKVAFFLDIAS